MTTVIGTSIIYWSENLLTIDVAKKNDIITEASLILAVQKMTQTQLSTLTQKTNPIFRYLFLKIILYLKKMTDFYEPLIDKDKESNKEL